MFNRLKSQWARDSRSPDRATSGQAAVHTQQLLLCMDPKPHQRSINPNAATKMSPKVKTLADMYKLSPAVVTVLTCINLYVRRQVAYVIVKWPTTESGKLKISRPVPY